MNVYDDITMEPRSREFESADRDTIRGLDFTFEKGIPVTVRVLSPEGENVPYALLNGFSVFGASDKLVMYLSSKRERFGLSASSDDLHLRGRASTTDIYPGMVFEILTERYETTSVSGRATDSSGKPIPLAYVEARSKNNSVRFSHFITRSRGITDGHGNFTVDGLILGDENIVIVEKLGYINGEETLNELISGMNKLGDIVLKPTQCWLEGLVMDKHGNPIVGATVHVWNDIFKNRAITVTNSKGQYRLEGLLPVMRTMQVDHADYRGYHGRDIVTSVNRNIVLLGYERYLEGTVTDEQGRPVQGAILYASFPELINKKTITDHNGHYRLEGLSGVTEDISVIHPDFGRSSYYFIPTNGSWDFTLIKPNGFFGGRVVSPDGTPVKDTSIRPVFNDYPSGSDQHASWTFYDEKRFRTDENGQFMIEGIIEGVFSVDLSNKDYHSIIINNIQSSRDDAILVMEKEPARTINDITPQMDVPRDGSPAPVLDISRWINCDPLSLMDLTGKIVVIDFFSKDDPLSCNETRTMEVLHKEYGIFVIGIHEHTEDIEAVQALIAKQGLSYPIAVDTPSKIEGGKGETFDVYGPRRYYHDILIDRDGKFRLNSNAHQMEQKLLDLIANEGR